VQIEETLEDIESARLAPALRDACFSIAKYLQKLDNPTLQFLPASYFYQKFEEEIDPTVLITALSTLSATEHALLQVHGFLQSGADAPYPLDDEVFFELLETGELVDPESGELIENPWSVVHLYYSVRDEFLA